MHITEMFNFITCILSLRLSDFEMRHAEMFAIIFMEQRSACQLRDGFDVITGHGLVSSEVDDFGWKARMLQRRYVDNWIGVRGAAAPQETLESLSQQRPTMSRFAVTKHDN